LKGGKREIRRLPPYFKKKKTPFTFPPQPNLNFSLKKRGKLRSSQRGFTQNPRGEEKGRGAWLFGTRSRRSTFFFFSSTEGEKREKAHLTGGKGKKGGKVGRSELHIISPSGGGGEGKKEELLNLGEEKKRGK